MKQIVRPGVTRGLAVAAVGALAVSGLSVAATPAAHAAAPGVRLLSQLTGKASVRLDQDYNGFDSSSTRLTARVTGAGAAVTFEVNEDPEAADSAGGWTDLGITVTNDGTFATATWNGDLPGSGRSLVGERVALRASATNVDGTTYSTRRNVEVTGDGSPTDAVDILTTSAAYFTQPYAGSDRTATLLPVSGSTSATDGTVALSSWRESTGAFTGRVSATVEPDSFKLATPTSSVDGGRFTGVLDITGFDAGAGRIAVAAERGTDDVSVIALTAQTITTVVAEAGPPVRAGEQGTVGIQVLDGAGLPVIGAEVRVSGSGTLVGYTDTDGELRATQAGGTSATYYANATDADAYDAADGDVESSSVLVDTYVPAPDSVQTRLLDGQVFDRDEHAAGDVGLLVLDQQGRPVGAGTDVSYQLYPSADPAPASYTTTTTNAQGVAVVPVPADAAGDYTMTGGLTADLPGSQVSTTFTTGQATLVLNPTADPAPAAAGGQIDYVGRLTLDGKPLPQRLVGLAYRRGYEVVPGNRPDAGILVDGRRVLTATATTNANGTVRVTVDDAAEAPQATEKGGVLTAATGTNVVSEDSTLTGNAGARDTSATSFGTAGPGKAKVTLRGRDNGAAADVLQVSGPASLAGERVTVFRTAGGKRVRVTTTRLNASGDLPAVRVKDKNGAARTTYVVQLLASVRVQASTSNPKSIR